MKYLENFSSLMPAVQGNKIIRRIEKQRKRGEIQTDAEFNASLQDALSNISISEFSPVFNFVPFQAQISSSEQFNEMMDLVRDDLEVLFIELNNIFSTIKAHNMLFQDKLLDELNFILTELENRTDRLAIVADTNNSFDDAFLNSFSGDNFALDRNNPFANEILFDKRRDLRIDDIEIGFIDSKEEALSLPLQNQEDIPFVEASVLTADTTSSEVNIQLVDSSIANIIDLDTVTSWAYNILVEDPIKNGAKLALELDLGDKREINFLRIHPVSDFPFFLEKIEYTNINNNKVDLPDTSFFNKTLQNPVRITFPDIIAKKIILRMSQVSSVLFDYDKNQPQVTFDDLKRNNSLSRSVSLLTDNIKQTVQDPDLRDVIPLAPEQGESFEIFNQYTFAFKDASAGLSSYRDNGFFVSKAYEKGSPGLIGLEADEIIPEFFDQEASVTAQTSSFEYSVIKKDYNGEGTIVDSKEFPILPLNTADITNERLFFSGSVSVIPLRFLGHGSDDKGTDIKIFRNNIELVRGTDWRFFDRLNPGDDADDDLFPGLDQTKIEIIQASNIIKNGIYTAEYTPRYIAEPNNVVTSAGVTYISNGVTEHPVKKDIEAIERSDLFLKIAIRNNSFFSNRTPKLSSYKLLVSSVDSDKFVRL